MGNHCNFSFPSRSRSFPGMEASDSLPKFREWIFFIPFPFPNFGNGFFSFPSRSRILGMDFFHSLPFPNFVNGFFPFPSRSRIDPFKVGNQKGKWDILRDASIPTKKMEELISQPFLDENFI